MIESQEKTQTIARNDLTLYKVKLIDPLNDGRWDPFIESHPNGAIYQHSSWIKVLALTYEHTKPLCFALEDQSCDIRAAIPCFIVRSRLTGTRIVSLPFSSYCDPLVDDKKQLITLLNEVTNILESISGSYYELRAFRSQDLIDGSGLQSHNYYKIHVLDIEEGFENILQAFHKKSIIGSIKKAEKSGVTVRQGCSLQDLKQFYLIHAATRKRQGFPIQPYRLFKNMWDLMYPKGYFTLLLAEVDKKVIAGLILFKFKDVVSAEYIAFIPKYLEARPNHYLLFKGIEMACSEGYHHFDFGKTPPENKGLLDFKRRWGAEMYDLPYFYYPQVKGMMSLEKNDLRHELLRSIGKHLPLSIAKIIGWMAYHHLG